MINVNNLILHQAMCTAPKELDQSNKFKKQEEKRVFYPEKASTDYRKNELIQVKKEDKPQKAVTKTQPKVEKSTLNEEEDYMEMIKRLQLEEDAKLAAEMAGEKINSDFLDGRLAAKVQDELAKEEASKWSKADERMAAKIAKEVNNFEDLDSKLAEQLANEKYDFEEMDSKLARELAQANDHEEVDDEEMARRLQEEFNKQ